MGLRRTGLNRRAFFSDSRMDNCAASAPSAALYMASLHDVVLFPHALRMVGTIRYTCQIVPAGSTQTHPEEGSTVREMCYHWLSLTHTPKPGEPHFVLWVALLLQQSVLKCMRLERPQQINLLLGGGGGGGGRGISNHYQRKLRADVSFRSSLRPFSLGSFFC